MTEENRGVIFSRPPRFLPEIPRGELEIPAPPSDQSKPEINWLSIFLPPIVMICGSVAMSMIMNRNPIYVMITVATTVVTIFLSVLNAANQIKKYRKYISVRKKKYLQLIADLRTEFKLAQKQQVSAMNEINPSPNECIERIQAMSSKLWERTPAHPDYLALRLGIGSVPATLVPKYEKASLMIEVDPLQEEPEKLGKEFEMVSDVPVCLNILQSELSGIAGSIEEVNQMLKILLLQVVTNHSYQDVKIVLLVKEEEEELSIWEWLKPVPHIWDNDFKSRFIMCSPIMAHQMLSQFYDEIKARENMIAKDKHISRGFTQYVFVISNPDLLDEEPIAKYLFEGNAALGITAIFTAERKEFLPMNCKSVVTLQGKTGTYAIKETSQKYVFNIDQLDESELENAGRKLAAIRLKKSAAQFTLPKSITLLETMGALKVEDVDVVGKWQQNKTYNGMGVPIGAKAGGELFYLDMQAYETSHGPHGLVAGTTGSGKSELLQSIIISLAIHFHPHDVVFVLIDYKGGGMADVFKGMPHLVGTITNLGGNQTTRALLSIKSELKRRQAIFSEYEVNNIDKYQKLYHSGKAKEPLPHLIMIADEFAELKAEQPDFMKELVSAARVGRSLGVHLILATQKPAGVVDDQIWSNSRFKICLKVQDEADSRDVIKRPDAARIKEPGRAYIQVGNDEIFEMFQSTFSGADYEPDGHLKRQKQQEKKKVFKVALNGQVTEIYPLERELRDKTEKDSQLKAMVEYIAKQAKENGIKPLKGPWLPPLEEVLYIDDILPKIGTNVQEMKQRWKENENGFVAEVGKIDDPKAQLQKTLKIDFEAEGNAIVYGAAGTGKTVFLETTIMSLAYKYSPEQFNLYIMDFGGGTLKKFEYLPHCGGVMSIDEEKKINQFMLFIFRLLEVRKEAFADQLVANIVAYNKVSETKFSHIVLIIDNYFALSESYEDVNDKLYTLAREGSKYGIYILMTSTSYSLIRYKLLINFRIGIALRLSDDGEYSSIVGRTEGLLPDNVVGRGLIKEVYPVEFQTALPHYQGVETVEILKWINQFDEVSKAIRIPEMPECVSIVAINKDTPLNRLVIGLNQDDMLPVQVELNSQVAISIAGEVQKGKSTLIISWVKMVIKKFKRNNIDLYVADSSNMGLLELLQEDDTYIDINDEELANKAGRELKRLITERREAINEYRKDNRELQELYDSWQQIIIVIDNISEFAENAESKILDTLEMIIKKGYGLKMLIIAAGELDEFAHSWESLVKVLKAQQTGVILGSIKEQEVFNVRVPYGYYERELGLGDGYFVLKNKYIPLRLAIYR